MNFLDDDPKAYQNIKGESCFNEREIIKLPLNNIQYFAEKVENWMHVLINIKTQNQIGEINSTRNSQDIEKIKRQSRRMSRRFSRNSSLKKDQMFKVKYILDLF